MNKKYLLMCIFFLLVVPSPPPILISLHIAVMFISNDTISCYMAINVPNSLVIYKLIILILYLIKIKHDVIYNASIITVWQNI